MSRDLDTAEAEAIAAPVVQLAWFGEFSFADGTVCIWTGIGEISALGRVFYGAGGLAGIGTIRESSSVESGVVEAHLDGIPSEYLALALAEGNRGRVARLWVGFFAADWSALLAPPRQMWVGRMGALQIADEGLTCSVRVPIEGLYFDIRRPRTRRMSHAEQQRKYPGDLGLYYLTWTGSQTLYFGTKGRAVLPPAAGGTRPAPGDNNDSGRPDHGGGYIEP